MINVVSGWDSSAGKIKLFNGSSLDIWEDGVACHPPWVVEMAPSRGLRSTTLTFLFHLSSLILYSTPKLPKTLNTLGNIQVQAPKMAEMLPKVQKYLTQHLLSYVNVK